MYKKFAVLAVVWCVTFAFWMLVKSWSMNPGISLALHLNWIWPLGLLLVSGAVLSLAYMLLDDIRFRAAAALLATLPFLFIFGFTRLNFIALVILILAQTYAMQAIYSELVGRTVINVRSIARAGTRIILSALIVAVSIVYYGSSSVKESVSMQHIPTQIQRTIQDAARMIVGPELAKLPPSERIQAEQQFMAQLTQQINQFVKPFLKFMPEILAIGLFLVLQGVNFIFIALALWLAMGIFLILRGTRFVRIEERDIKAERLVL